MPVTVKQGPTTAEVSRGLSLLCGYLSKAQHATLKRLCHSSTEEHEHFRELVTTYAKRIQAMPATYQSEGKEAVAVLHYFTAGCDWYIVEKDSDPDNEGQVQAFGSANLGFGAELGYISLPEITAAGAELDLYFTPKPLADCEK